MPSAYVKIDKQSVIPPENPLPDATGSLTPLRQVVTLVEHKIRNLEKRKSKLESYRDLQTAGKELNADQKTAVAKYDEVTQTLEFARDIYKQFLSIAVISEKDAKKQARREAAAKTQAEMARLREILLVQDALNQMGSEAVREDFLRGRNGAAQLAEGELKLLDDLYPAVTPKHEAGNPTAFTNEVQAAAEHLLAVVDGRPKEVLGGTYGQVKEVIGKIHESGYFDQSVGQEREEAAAEAGEVVEPEVVEPEVVEQEEVVEQQQEAVFYQPPPPVLQPPPQLHTARPISEMIETGNFFFLQDSEIEQEQITSQTFTNQSFVPGQIVIAGGQLYQGQVQVQVQAPPMIGNNGLEEDVPKEEALHKARGDNNRWGSAPSRGNHSYQNNNEYNNRPRQNRNGPRPAGNNRHNN